jgi:hypothetical protein
MGNGFEEEASALAKAVADKKEWADWRVKIHR